MVKYEANLIEQNEDRFLELCIGEAESLKLPLTEDNPQKVKNIFNELIVRLKKGRIKFRLNEVERPDLYWQVCNEYITQLNRELESVYDELEDYSLLEP